MCVCVLQYIVIPTRRSSAEAVQILLSHALGDAGSPYLVGLVCSLVVGKSFLQLCCTVFTHVLFTDLLSSLRICSFPSLKERGYVFSRAVERLIFLIALIARLIILIAR